MKIAVLSCFLFSFFTSPGGAQEPIIFVVRHAERADSNDGSSSPNDPGLSEAGKARAMTLSALLKDAGITAIYATEYKRTQLTAAPLANMTGVHVEVVPGKETASLVAKLKRQPGHVVVIAHSNTIPEILKGLGTKTRVTVAESEYDNLFVVVGKTTPELIQLHYH